MAGRRRLVVLLASWLVVPGTAGAQSSLPLLLEAARDSGSFDLAASARAVALGGVAAPKGGADDAPGSPAGLMIGPARSLVLSLGRHSASGNILRLTPRDLPPRDATRHRTDWSTVPTAFAAASLRRRAFAVAGFLDASPRERYAFSTAVNMFDVSAIPGTIVETKASGAGERKLALRRLGGALAFGSPRLSVGVSLYVAHLGGTVSSAIDIETRVQHYAPFPPSDVTIRSRDVNAVTFDESRIGGTASVRFQPARVVALAGRWRRDPQFRSTRESDAGAMFVTFRPPDVVAGSVTVAGSQTSAAIEVLRTGYRDVYGPRPAPISPTSSCQILRVSACEGWGFGSYVAANATGLRLGIEREIRITSGSIPTGLDVSARRRPAPLRTLSRCRRGPTPRRPS